MVCYYLNVHFQGQRVKCWWFRWLIPSLSEFLRWYPTYCLMKLQELHTCIFYVRKNSKTLCTFFSVALVYFHVINERKSLCDTCIIFYISIYFSDNLVFCGMKWVSTNETPVRNTTLTGNISYDGSLRNSLRRTTKVVVESVTCKWQ